MGGVCASTPSSEPPNGPPEDTKQYRHGNHNRNDEFPKEITIDAFSFHENFIFPFQFDTAIDSSKAIGVRFEVGNVMSGGSQFSQG